MYIYVIMHRFVAAAMVSLFLFGLDSGLDHLGPNVCVKNFILILLMMITGNNTHENSSKGNTIMLMCCPDYYEENNLCLPCKPGKFGKDCKETCLSGKYGMQCKRICVCLHFETCHPELGCMCPNGYTGDNCTKVVGCDYGRFGNNCSEECKCNDGLSCDRSNGECLCNGQNSSCIGGTTTQYKIDLNHPSTHFITVYIGMAAALLAVVGIVAAVVKLRERLLQIRQRKTVKLGVSTIRRARSVPATQGV